MNTPIYNALVLEYGRTGGQWTHVDGTPVSWKITSIEVIRKPPVPSWRTFLRCLFWWLP